VLILVVCSSSSVLIFVINTKYKEQNLLSNRWLCDEDLA